MQEPVRVSAVPVQEPVQALAVPVQELVQVLAVQVLGGGPQPAICKAS